MWQPSTEPWQYRLLDALPPGVDLAQLAAARKMTPTERVESARRLLEFAEMARAARRRE